MSSTINYSYPSHNYDNRPCNQEGGCRPNFIILHATECNFDLSLRLLTQPSSYPVSAHYLIDLDGSVYQLVADHKRAWHAGQSFWQGQEKLNDTSLGIEIVNWAQQPYPPAQIAACIALCKHLMNQYAIDLRNVLAHSDIAPYRKTDPGAHFPWQQLAQENIVPTLPPLPISLPDICFQTALKMLGEIGYDVRPLACDASKSLNLVQAFQQRYLTHNITGILNALTFARIRQVFNFWQGVKG